MNINNSAISDNSVASLISNDIYGGGLFINTVKVTITDSSVTNNVAGSSMLFGIGGGICIFFSPFEIAINRTFISGNTAVSAGGIYANTTLLQIKQSAVVNNTATQNAGGIGVNTTTESFTSITNSTIAENKANGFGGGLQIISQCNVCTAAPVLEINFSTIARNTANQDNFGSESGGGIRRDGPVLTFQQITRIKNSVVADNTVGSGGTNPDIDGIFVSQGYNHIETVPATFTPTTGDVTGTDPLLGSLILNGSNSIFIPAANSPLIDAIPNGTNDCGTAPFNVDQRGVVRPTDSNRDSVAACEKGAVEVAAPTAASVSVSGRVLASGRGVAGTLITMTDAVGEVHSTVTDALGYYYFTDVQAGASYIINVSSEQYSFTPQVVDVFEEITNLNFTSGKNRKSSKREWY